MSKGKPAAYGQRGQQKSTEDDKTFNWTKQTYNPRRNKKPA